MEAKDLAHTLIKQVEEMHQLLKENNLLLKEMMEQNQLIFEITQINIKSFSHHYPWYQKIKHEVKTARKLRKQLDNLFEKNWLRNPKARMGFNKYLA